LKILLNFLIKLSTTSVPEDSEQFCAEFILIQSEYASVTH